jgi:hypothetical protein
MNGSAEIIQIPAIFQLAKIMAVALVCSAVFAMTILGWVAVTQIRRSAGKLHGLWLAVFDGLLFPLLVLDGALAWLWLVLAKLFARQVLGLQNSLFLDLWDLTIWVSLALASVALVDWLIIRRVWRAVNRPLAGEKMSAGIPQAAPARKSSTGRNIAIGCGLLAPAILIAALLSAYFKTDLHPEVHYCVFEVESALADQLVPVAQRQIGATGNWQMAEINPATLAALLDGRVLKKHVMVDRQLEVPKPSSSPTYVNIEKPGVKEKQQKVIVGWPVVADNFVYTLRKEVLNDIAQVSGTGFFGVRRKEDGLQLKLEYDLTHKIADRPAVDVNITYEGNAPQNGARAFFIPFARKDDTTGYYLFTVEVVEGTTKAGLTDRRVITGPPFVARLNQAEVELVAVGNLPWTNPACWLPNGQPSAEPFPTGYGSVEQWSENMDVKKVAFYIRNESADGISTPVCRISKESGAQPASSGWSAPDKRTPNGYFGQIIVSPSNTATMNVSVGVANGPWETATTLHSGLGGSGSANGDWSATCQAVAGGGNVAINCIYTKNEDWESRIVCVDADGKTTVIPENTSHASALPTTGGLLMVSSNVFAHIKEFRLQKRKYQWAEFRNVSLQPGHRTTVTVKDSGGENQAVPTMSAAPDTAIGFSCGRVMQFTLPLDKDGLTPLFDLDQDQPVFDPNPNDTAAGMAQLLKPGVVIRHDEPAHKIVLLGMSGTVLYWASASLGDQWEKLTDTNALAAVRRNLTSLGVMQGIDSPDKLPQTAFFKTGAGRLGLLQLTGFTANPRGVKIRYKLVQQNAKTGTAQVDDELVRLKLQIANSELEIAKRKFQSDVVAHAGNDLSASNIVALMQQAYATIYTYRDTGQTVSQNGQYVWTNKFSEVLSRMNRYRIEVVEVVTAQNPFSQTNRWWSDGNSHYWQSGGSIVFKRSEIGSSISQVNNDSTVPALFYNLNWGNILDNMAYASATELVRQKDEAVSRVDCYVLEQADYGWTVWVGKQDFLIRRYRNFISKAAAVEAMKHSPRPNINSVPAQDITFIQTHENVIVNEDLKREDFISATDDGK